MPKERWIIHPGAGRDGDPSPVIAWAGWDHLQQAKALAGAYVEAGTQPGWTPEKLQPLLAGVADLLPWLKPWHFDPEVTSGLGDYFAGFPDEATRKPGTTLEALNRLSRNDSVEKSFNHGWTRINTDWKRLSETKMRSPIGAFYQVR